MSGGKGQVGTGRKGQMSTVRGLEAVGLSVTSGRAWGDVSRCSRAGVRVHGGASGPAQGCGVRWC